MFGSKTPFGSGGFGSTSSAFGSQQTTPFGATSGGKFFDIFVCANKVIDLYDTSLPFPQFHCCSQHLLGEKFCLRLL